MLCKERDGGFHESDNFIRYIRDYGNYGRRIIAVYGCGIAGGDHLEDISPFQVWLQDYGLNQHAQILTIARPGRRVRVGSGQCIDVSGLDEV